VTENTRLIIACAVAALLAPLLIAPLLG